MKWILLPLAGLATALLAHVNESHAQEKIGDPVKGTIIISSLKDGKTDLEYYDNGHDYKVRVVQTKIVEMYVDSKKLPENSYAPYQSTVDRIVRQIENDEKNLPKPPAASQGNNNQFELVQLNVGSMSEDEQEIKDRRTLEKEKREPKKRNKNSPRP